MCIRGFKNKEKYRETMGTWSQIFSSTKLFSGKSFSGKCIDFRADSPGKQTTLYTTTTTCMLLT